MTQEILHLMEERRKNKNNKSVYMSLKKQIRKKCREEKEKWVNQKCAEIENLEQKHDNFNLYKKIKEFTHTDRKRIPKKLLDDHGRLITDEEEELKVWNSYIKELFNDERRDIEMTDRTLEGPEIIKSELINALKATKDGKAAGPDQLNVELLKLLDEKNQDVLLNLFNQIYKSGKIPEEWLVSEFITLPKKQNAKHCNEYRLISLMSHALKLFLRIIHTRIWRKIDNTISETQFGFRNNMGTREALFAIQVLVQKCLDQQTSAMLCFIDYEKAFDKVKHDKLITILQNIGLDSRDINIIKNLYWNQTAYVQSNCSRNESIKIMKGVRQGCVLSPLLFNLYSETIFQQALEDIGRGIKINGKVLNNIRFADDTVVMANNIDDLQLLVDRIQEVSSEFGLSINRNKTKLMVVTKTPILNIQLNIRGLPVERVDKVKYLGCWLNDKWDSDTEVKSRIEIARNTFCRLRPLLSCQELNLKTRWRATHCFVLSTLLYGMEGWTLKTTTMRRLETFEMWLFRRLLKISWTDHITNEEVLRRMNRDRELMGLVKRKKASYFGHIFRHQRYELLQLIMEGKIEGRRGLGRKKFSWLRNLRDWFHIRDAASLIRLAQNREDYQVMIANLH